MILPFITKNIRKVVLLLMRRNHKGANIVVDGRIHNLGYEKGFFVRCAYPMCNQEMEVSARFLSSSEWLFVVHGMKR